MPFWFFKQRPAEPIDPVELRQKLIDAAATGSPRTLRSVCRKYKGQVAPNLDLIRKIPEGMPKDDATMNRYAQCLIAVAQCLAQDCNSPDLWNAMTGTAADNSLIQFQNWFNDLPGRMKRLEFDALISEAEAFIERAKTLGGEPARQQEAYLCGRLGELLFHRGKVAECLRPFEAAFELCIGINDLEGQFVYLNNLIEAHLYLDDKVAVQTAERLLQLKQQNGVADRDLEARISRLRTGEPLCRVVCVRDNKELELNEVTSIGEGSYQFVFKRNRLHLQMATLLTEQGNQLASSGELSAALEKYREASEVDPYNPDPVYQMGECLLGLGAYSTAKESFEEVERLAPGWFRCRSDRWLAEGLESGTISDEEFRLLRILEDAGLPPKQAMDFVTKGLERFPEFAPIYLIKGDLYGNRGDDQQAASAYRQGLDLVDEPDLESRLLCALAGVLPVENEERYKLIDRAQAIPGSLVAHATARLMELQRTSSC